MEENQENVEKIAAQENKDASNVIVDESTNQIIDVEELLQGQDPVASKLNNLMKIGVSIEQIKNVYEIAGGTKPGITLDAALEELNKVFYILARGINESSSALVVNLLTGALDIEACEKRAIELGYEDGYIAKDKIMNTEEQFLLADALNMMLGKEKVEQTMMFAEMDNALYSDFFFNMKDLSLELSEKEIEDIADKFHMDKEEMAGLMNSARDNIKAGAILTHTENNVHDAIAKYMRYVSNQRPNAQRQKCLDELKDAIMACPEEERKKFEKYLNEDGTIDTDSLVEDEKQFMKIRNQGAINVRFMAFITGEANFLEMDDNAKEKLLISLARSLKYDNVDMQKLGKVIAEYIGIDYSYEGIRNLLNQIVNRDLQTDKDVMDLAKRGELDEYTAEEKYAEIRSNLNENIGKDPNAVLKDRVTVRAIQEYDRREEVTLLAVHRIGTQLNKSGHDFRGYEIAIIFKQLYDQDKNSPEIKAIAKYIENNTKFFEDFFREKENYSIFNDNGTVSIDRIERVIDGVRLEPENYENIKYMMKGIEGSKKSFESEKNRMILERVRELRERDKIYLKGITKAEIINLINSMNFVAITKEQLEELITIDPRITDAVVAKKQQVEERLSLKKISHTLRLDNKTREDALRDTALLLEARIIAAKGTPLYGKLTSERDAFYDNNPDACKYRDEIRDAEGNITEKGQEMIDDYLEGYRRKKISNHLKDIITQEVDTPEEKQNVAKWLIVALKNGNHKVRQEAIQKMKKIFPQYDTNEMEVSTETMIENLMFEAYGKKIGKDAQTKIEQQLTENFTKLILKESIIITDKTLTDDNFHEFFDTHAEGFDASLTNLSVSEFQNYFEDSQIKYGAEDDKDLEKLYAQSTINSWLTTKEDADRLSYLALKTIQAESKFLRHKTTTDEQIEKYLEEHKDGSEEWFTEEGIMNSYSKMEAQLYIDNKMTSEVLKGFSRNVFKENKSFETMNPEEKVTVLEQIVVALGHINTTVDPLARKVLTKLTYRAAEMLNTEDRQIFKIGKGKKMLIDEAAFMKLYNKTCDSKVLPSGNLNTKIAETYDAYRKGFFLNKAVAYSEKGEDDFHELQSGTYVEKLMEIEQLKVQEREKHKETHKDKVEYETSSQAHFRKVIGKNVRSLYAKTGGHFKLVNGPQLRKKTDFFIDEDGVKVVINDDQSVTSVNVKKVYNYRTAQKEPNEAISGFKFEEIDTSAIDESVKTADNIEEPSVVTMKEPRPDETQEQKPGETSSRFEQAEPQDEDYKVAINDAKEEKGLKAFFKRTWEKITNKRLGTGQEENKKPGFFARLFNRKEDTTLITEETTSIKSPVQENKTFADYIRVENPNASVEHGAMDASAKGVDGAKNNIAGKGQPETEEISQEQ